MKSVIFLLLYYGYKERYHWIAFLTIRPTPAASQVWYIRGVSKVWLLNAKHAYSFSAIFHKEISLSQYRIAIVIGSLRRDSFNRKLAGAVMRLAPPELTFKQSQIGDLPLYNQDDDGNQAEPVKRLKSEITDAHGLLFVTPEYNRSMPGVLKNAIDHASRPYGENAWAGKPAGVIGASIGARGHSHGATAPAQYARLPGCTDARPA